MSNCHQSVLLCFFQISLSVDDRFQEEYGFPGDIQFLAPGDVYLGGTENSRASTGNLAVPSFNGGMALVIIINDAFC